MQTSLPSALFRRGIPAVLLALFALVLAGRAEDAPAPAGVLAFTIEVPAGKLSLKEVHDVVLRASIVRGWNVKSEGPDRIVIHLEQRKNEATVTYLVSESTVQAYCEGYATNGKGVRKGPEQPSGWLNFLKSDITKGLNMAAYLGKK